MIFKCGLWVTKKELVSVTRREEHSKNRVCFQTWLSCREGLGMLWGRWREASRRQVSSQVLLSDSHLPRGASARPGEAHSGHQLALP